MVLHRFFIDFLILLISAIPLHISINLFGGKTNFFKTIIVMLIGGFLVAAVKNSLNVFSGIISFFFLLALYHYAFRLGWMKTFFAWLFQFIFIFLVFLLLALIII